jgi:hypothetical protein
MASRLGIGRISKTLALIRLFKLNIFTVKTSLAKSFAQATDVTGYSSGSVQKHVKTKEASLE